MDTETFKTVFKTMCQDKYPHGATLMEIFMALNNPDVTLKQIKNDLSTLFDQGFCKHHTDESGERFLYQEPVSMSVSSTNASPSNDFFNQFLQTFQKSQSEMKNSLQEMITLQKQTLNAFNTMKTPNVNSSTAKVVDDMDDLPPLEDINFTKKTVPTQIKVKSFKTDELYDVDTVNKTCTCKHFTFVQSKANPPGQCKHIKAALENQPAIQAAFA